MNLGPALNKLTGSAAEEAAPVTLVEPEKPAEPKNEKPEEVLEKPEEQKMLEEVLQKLSPDAAFELEKMTRRDATISKCLTDADKDAEKIEKAVSAGREAAQRPDEKDGQKFEDVDPKYKAIAHGAFVNARKEEVEPEKSAGGKSAGIEAEMQVTDKGKIGNLQLPPELAAALGGIALEHVDNDKPVGQNAVDQQQLNKAAPKKDFGIDDMAKFVELNKK